MPTLSFRHYQGPGRCEHCAGDSSHLVLVISPRVYRHLCSPCADRALAGDQQLTRWLFDLPPL